MTPENESGAKASRWRTIAAGTGLLVLLGAIALGRSVYQRWSEGFRDFPDIWNTTDAISMYVDTNNRWPTDWAALDPYLPAVGGDIRSDLPNHVDVNFCTEGRTSPESSGWFVHLKNNHLPGEERAANERLASVARLCAQFETKHATQSGR